MKTWNLILGINFRVLILGGYDQMEERVRILY